MDWDCTVTTIYLCNAVLEVIIEHKIKRCGQTKHVLLHGIFETSGRGKWYKNLFFFPSITGPVRETENLILRLKTIFLDLEKTCKERYKDCEKQRDRLSMSGAVEDKWLLSSSGHAHNENLAARKVIVTGVMTLWCCAKWLQDYVKKLIKDLEQPATTFGMTKLLLTDRQLLNYCELHGSCNGTIPCNVLPSTLCTESLSPPVVPSLKETPSLMVWGNRIAYWRELRSKKATLWHAVLASL